jgi:predicted Zn-dependent peptidase
MKERYRKTVLESGIRVISNEMPWVRSVSIGVWLDCGSRDEEPEENGISHLIEHLVFKGTKKRSARQIALALESVGGSLNAFTGREHTCYYAKVLEEHAGAALEVLSDILENSLFRPADFKKEKSVIVEEIMDTEDTPGDLVFDLFMQSMWGEHPLGRPIMGTLESVSSIKRKQVLDYFRKNYIYPRVVIAASGKVSHDKLAKDAEKRFRFNQQISEKSSPAENLIPYPVRKVTRRKSAQTHVCLGLPNFSFTHPRKYAALILSNILGGGMSSRLFQKIREKHGLAYNVYSFSDFFDDGGVLGIYLGTSPKKVVRAVNSILKEISSIKKNRISPKEMEHAKYQLKGGLILGAESTAYQMNRLARHELFFQDHFSLDKTISLIDKVRARDVMEAANQLLDWSKLCLTVLGPTDKKILSKIDWK